MACQHVSSLTNDLDILHHLVIDADVVYELFITDAFDYLLHVLGLLQDVLKAPAVSAMLSHK